MGSPLFGVIAKYDGLAAEGLSTKKKLCCSTHVEPNKLHLKEDHFLLRWHFIRSFMVMGIQEESLLSSSLQFFALNFFGSRGTETKKRPWGRNGLVDLWDGLVISYKDYFPLQ